MPLNAPRPKFEFDSRKASAFHDSAIFKYAAARSVPHSTSNILPCSRTPPSCAPPVRGIPQILRHTGTSRSFISHEPRPFISAPNLVPIWMPARKGIGKP